MTIILSIIVAALLLWARACVRAIAGIKSQKSGHRPDATSQRLGVSAVTIPLIGERERLQEAKTRDIIYKRLEATFKANGRTPHATKNPIP